MKSGFCRQFLALFAGLLCVSCGGGSDGGSPSDQTDLPSGMTSAGAIVVENNNAYQYINSAGDLKDIDDQNTTIISEEGRGYSFGFGIVPLNTYGQILAEDGEESYMGIAAIHPNSDVGDQVTGSLISYSGTYELQYQQIASSGDLGESHNANGQFFAHVDLNSGTGTISDDFMSGSSQAVTGSNLTIGDGIIDGQDFEIEVSYEGAEGYLTGAFGTDGLVGAMSGEGPDGFFVGGAIASIE